MANKSNTKRAPKILEDIRPTEPVEIAPPVVAQPNAVQLDEKGRIKVVAMSMMEWDDICKEKGLKTKSAMIRYLVGSGYSPSAVAKFLGVIYQHVRNVMNQQLKRPVTESAPVANADPETKE